MDKRTAQKGFTLIELVVVITILGILAAFAIPRFASLEVEARKATVEGMAGSLRSGAALAHALWLAQGQPATVTMEGQPITIIRGYPNNATIENTIVDTTGFAMTNAGGGRRFTKLNGAGTPIAACYVTYIQPASANVPPTIQVNPNIAC